MLGVHCLSVQAFSVCGELLFIAVCGILIAVASLFADKALGARASVVAAHRL